jgi:ABC-2 type transport system ATP-binding protein
VATGTAATLGGRDTEAAIITFTLPAGVPVTGLPALVAAAVTGCDGQKVTARAPDPLPLLGALAGWAQARAAGLPDLNVHRPTLEDVYLQLTRGSR